MKLKIYETKNYFGLKEEYQVRKNIEYICKTS